MNGPEIAPPGDFRAIFVALAQSDVELNQCGPMIPPLAMAEARSHRTIRKEGFIDGQYEADRPERWGLTRHCLSCIEQHGQSARTVAQAGSRRCPSGRLPAQPASPRVAQRQ